MYNALPAANNIWWVGALDPTLEVFDVIMRTETGTTYNSYLVKGSEKTVLFETVKEPFFEEHLARIKQVCDPAEIDYIVLNHTEPDHSGSLTALLALAPKAQVLASNTAINFLKEIVNGPFLGRAVTEKDEISLGDKTLRFFITPMLHWPDTMLTYIQEDAALFTCDVFGCHYCDTAIFNDQISAEFLHAYKYYFDMIMGPYKNPHMLNALKKIEGLNIRFIGTGHGPALRKDADKYLALYREWATPAPHPSRVTVAYVSSYGYTQKLALAMEKGLVRAGVAQVSVLDLVETPMKKAQLSLEEADGFLLGSPTMVGDALPPAYEAMLGLNPVIHRGKFAGAFGSFAWSGEGAGNLMARMETLKLKLPLPPFKVKLKPTGADLAAAEAHGYAFGRAVLGLPEAEA